MAENGIKVSQIAKDLKVTGKDIIERLAGFGISLKSTSVLNEEQLGLIFDIYTQLHDVGDAPIIKPEPKSKEKKEEEPKVREEQTEQKEEKASE
ncbi:MAG: translation initiation factor IF-2 N-terminal domain-containing protein, partial [Firmicutes bacterium]|nr:translation initiation factor IF-2 N-terminal domain-containing protein [Bacillota bacterium]